MSKSCVTPPGIRVVKTAVKFWLICFAIAMFIVLCGISVVIINIVSPDAPLVLHAIIGALMGLIVLSATHLTWYAWF